MTKLGISLMRTRKISYAQAELLEAKIFREQAERAAKKKAERAKAEPELPGAAALTVPKAEPLS